MSEQTEREIISLDDTDEASWDESEHLAIEDDKVAIDDSDIWDELEHPAPEPERVRDPAPAPRAFHAPERRWEIRYERHERFPDLGWGYGLYGEHGACEHPEFGSMAAEAMVRFDWSPDVAEAIGFLQANMREWEEWGA